MQITNWLEDKVLPLVAISGIIAMLTLYVSFESEKQATEEYRKNTHEYRERRKEMSDQNEKILCENKEAITKLQENRVTKDTYYGIRKQLEK